MAYGQTGTGKTFTMLGAPAAPEAGQLPGDAGVIPRAAASLFERKAMETQMFRKAQEAKARAKALAGLDWKNHVLEKYAGCWFWNSA